MRRFFKLLVCDTPDHFCTKLLEIKACRNKSPHPILEAATSQSQLFGIFCDKVMRFKNLAERLQKIMLESSA